MDESSKLFHLDNSSDLQQHKSSVEQLQARLPGAKISYQTVKNRSNQFCSAWTEVLHLSWGSKETQRCLNITFFCIEEKMVQKLMEKKKNKQHCLTYIWLFGIYKQNLYK